MSWYTLASNDKIFAKIKRILKENTFIRDLMSNYEIPLEALEKDLQFKIQELDGRFAEGNGYEIILDPKLFSNNDFFENNFHFVIHELFHWMKRRQESKFYFKDPEEIQSFVLAIAWELLNGKKQSDIYKSIYPIVEAHFENKKNAKELFKDMVNQAYSLMRIYKKD